MRRKILLLLIAMILTCITLVTSSFAWFSINTVNVVEQFNLTVINGVGINVSLDSTGGTPSSDVIKYDKKKWENNITTSELDEVIGNKVKLTACTTKNGITFSKDVMKEQEAVVNVDYIELVIYFKVLNANIDSKGTASIYLTDIDNTVEYDGVSEGCYLTSKGVNFIPKVKYYENLDVVGLAGTRYAKNAARMSFIGTNMVKSQVFDFGSDNSRGYGYPYGALSYFEQRKGTKLTIPSTPDCFVNQTYANTDANHTKGFTTLALDDELNDNIYYSSDNNSRVCILDYIDDTYYGYTTIRVWLEGWDGDCYDAIYEDKLKIQLSFRFGVSKI